MKTYLKPITEIDSSTEFSHDILIISPTGNDKYSDHLGKEYFSIGLPTTGGAQPNPTLLDNTGLGGEWDMDALTNTHYDDGEY